MFKDGIKWAAGGVLLAALIAGAAACGSSSNNGSPEPTNTPVNGAGGGEFRTPTVVAIESPVATPPPVPLGWKEFSVPRSAQSDAFSFSYPPGWTLEPPAKASPETLGLSVIARSYQVAGPSFPEGAIKVSISTLPRSMAGYNEAFQCPARSAPMTDLDGRSLRRVELSYADAKPGEISRAAGAAIETEEFGYCVGALFEARAEQNDRTFDQILASLRIEGWK